MNTWIHSIVALSFGLVLIGCDLPSIAREDHYTLDGVKWIDPKVSDPLAPESIQAQTYRIGPESRLLLALENLQDLSLHVDRASAPVLVYVHVEPGEGAWAEQNLRLCPLTTNWMMRATWDTASPFRRWSNRGGDFDRAGCVKGTEDPSYRSGVDSIVFDMTDWGIHYLQTRKINNGFMLISEQPVTVWGDGSSAAAPEIRFRR